MSKGAKFDFYLSPRNTGRIYRVIKYIMTDWGFQVIEMFYDEKNEGIIIIFKPDANFKEQHSIIIPFLLIKEAKRSKFDPYKILRDEMEKLAKPYICLNKL